MEVYGNVPESQEAGRGTTLVAHADMSVIPDMVCHLSGRFFYSAAVRERQAGRSCASRRLCRG